MKKLLLIGSLFLVSCKKDTQIQPTSEWKGNTFVRVESVGKDGKSSYSTVSHINIK